MLMGSNARRTAGDHQAIAHAVEVMVVDAVLGPGAGLRSAEGAEILEILALRSTILEWLRRGLPGRECG